MSRFLKVMIVLLAIAAMATPVMAEDMLSLGGQMRVRGMYQDNGSDTTNTFFDQRLRIGGKLAVADGVSITFRTDVSEGTWGSDNGYGRFGSVLAWDRAHLDLANDKFAFRAGTQNFLYGNATIDAQETGFTFTVKGAVPVNVFFSLIDRNLTAASAAVAAGYTCDCTTGTAACTAVPASAAVAAGNDSDAYLYGAQVAFAGFKVFAANQKDGAEEDAYLLGATYSATYDAIKVNAELDFFTGDASSTMDAQGTQFVMNATMAASEAASVGGAVYYALGADANETQYSYFGNGFNAYDPLNYGPLENDNLLVIVRPADVFGDAGVMALQVFGDFKVSDAANVTASLAYAEPEEDANTTADSAIFMNVGGKYALMANTAIAAQVQYVDYDQANYEEQLSAEVKLSVNF